MTGSSRVASLLFAGLFALFLSACSKGASSLDETENEEAGEEDGTCDTACGNDKIDGNCGEECDGKELDEVSCETLGFTGGRLGCDSVSCRFNTTMCERKEAFIGTGG